MIVPRILVCSSFLISGCMFIMSDTVIIRAREAIWLNLVATALFTVCSAVTVNWCVCTRIVCVCLVCLLLCKEKGSSPVSLQLVNGGICAYMSCFVFVFVGFWDGDYMYVSQLPYVWNYLLLRAV